MPSRVNLVRIHGWVGNNQARKMQTSSNLCPDHLTWPHTQAHTHGTLLLADFPTRLETAGLLTHKHPLKPSNQETRRAERPQKATKKRSNPPRQLLPMTKTTSIHSKRTHKQMLKPRSLSIRRLRRQKSKRRRARQRQLPSHSSSGK